MQKEILEEIYQNHHQSKGRYGYLFCNGARGLYLKEWIGVGKRVLDLGCRDGMLTSHFVSGNEVIGVDIDQTALEIAHQKLGIETVWADLNAEWPFPERSFDVIVACELIEHLFLLDSFLDCVAKTLKPGGQFIGSVPNAFRLRNRLKFLFGREYELDPTHVRQFSYLKLQEMLEKRFFHVEIFPLQGKIFPLIPVFPSLPKKLSSLFAKDLLWRSTTST